MAVGLDALGATNQEAGLPRGPRVRLGHPVRGVGRASRLTRRRGTPARTWYEYVRSKANPGDEPSQVMALAQEQWQVLRQPGISSKPVPVRFPQVEDWRVPTGWARMAARLAAIAASRR